MKLGLLEVVKRMLKLYPKMYTRAWFNKNDSKASVTSDNMNTSAVLQRELQLRDILVHVPYQSVNKHRKEEC